MLKLLVPVDGSDCALNAVRWAIRLAKENVSLKVHLLSVYLMPVQLGDIGVAVTAAQMEDIERRLTGPILSTAEDLLREAGIACELETRAAGDVAQMIVMRANDLGCDEIVMGTRGTGALSSVVLGSVAGKVVRMAKVPVTLVK